MKEMDNDCSVTAKLLRFINRVDVSAEDIDRALGTQGGTESLGNRILEARSRLIEERGESFINLSELDRPEILADVRLGSILDAVLAGALDESGHDDTGVTPGMILPSFIVSTPAPSTYLEFLPWYALARPCTIAKVTRTETYSRGNNDQAEMTTQKAKTGLTQYETGTFDLEFIADPTCLCVQGKCIGDITLTVNMKITLKAGAAPLAYMLVPGPNPSTPTTPIAGGAAPGPDVNVGIDTIDIPNPDPGNRFIRPAAGKSEFTASASNTFPCAAGTYARRFHIFPNAMAGRKGVTPGRGAAALVFFIDVNATVTKTGTCKGTITLETFMMEFRLGYDFTHGGALPAAGAELPEVRPTLPAGMGGGAGNNTHNITKRTSVNGTATDTPFPPKAP
jgi:hypothetical protein